MAEKPSHDFDIAAANEMESRVRKLVGQNRFKPALAACEQLNRQFPEFGAGWHTASYLALKIGNAPMALAAIQRALSFDPENVLWQLQEATCLLRLGRLAEVDTSVQRLSSQTMMTA